jgi:hypothetical protein
MFSPPSCALTRTWSEKSLQRCERFSALRNRKRFLLRGRATLENHGAMLEAAFVPRAPGSRVCGRGFQSWPIGVRRLRLRTSSEHESVDCHAAAALFQFLAHSGKVDGRPSLSGALRCHAPFREKRTQSRSLRELERSRTSLLALRASRALNGLSNSFPYLDFSGQLHKDLPLRKKTPSRVCTPSHFVKRCKDS